MLSAASAFSHLWVCFEMACVSLLLQILPWFVLCFWQMWCAANECEAIGTYKTVSRPCPLGVLRALAVCLPCISCVTRGDPCVLHVALLACGNAAPGAADVLKCCLFPHSSLGDVQATDVIWKVLVCLMLFALANFLKSVLTKLLSSHFYKYVFQTWPVESLGCWGFESWCAACAAYLLQCMCGMSWACDNV